jgi:hypothetical protein
VRTRTTTRRMKLDKLDLVLVGVIAVIALLVYHIF